MTIFLSNCAELFFVVSMYQIPSYHSKFKGNYMGNLFKIAISTALLNLLPAYVFFLMLLMTLISSWSNSNKCSKKLTLHSFQI
jgi:hypothetical protein